MSVLNQLATALGDGSVRVVDLTQPLGPDTPVIGLPDMFGQSPGLTMSVISRYDDAGPGWYWNTLTLGEHTGTHFDAPVHWITGKDLADNTTETIPADRLVAPACVLDCSGDAAGIFFDFFVLSSYCFLIVKSCVEHVFAGFRVIRCRKHTFFFPCMCFKWPAACSNKNVHTV